MKEKEKVKNSVTCNDSNDATMQIAHYIIVLLFRIEKALHESWVAGSVNSCKMVSHEHLWGTYTLCQPKYYMSRYVY